MEDGWRKSSEQSKIDNRVSELVKSIFETERFKAGDII
jgi:hypothetical protein